jgi:hypothetical protein
MAKFAAAAVALGLVAAAIIQLPGFYLNQAPAQKALALAVTIGAAGGTYFLMVALMRAREIGELRDIFLRRRPRTVVGGE